MNTFLAQVKNAVICDSVGRKKNGNVVVRQGYFYRRGQTSDSFAVSVSKQLKVAGVAHNVIASGDHFAAFRGGANTASSSHFWVELAQPVADAKEVTPADVDLPIGFHGSPA